MAAQLSQDEYMRAVSLYQYLRKTARMNGVDAYKIAFPNGLPKQPTAEELAKQQADAAQKAGYGQIGGLLAGALGTKAVYDAVTGQPILGGIFGKGGSIGSLFSGGGGGAVEAASGIGPIADGAGYASSLGGNALSGVSGIGPVADGGAYVSSLQGTGSGLSNALGSATPYLGAAGAALGAYGAFQGIKNKNPLGAALGGGGIGLGLNAMGYALGPVGWAAALGAPALLALGNKFFDQKSTKEYQQERWGKLAESSSPAMQQYANQYLQYMQNAPEEHKERGRNFDALQAAGQLRPEEVWGAQGIMKSMGNDWLTKYSEQQRRDISQEALKRQMFRGDKGDIGLVDPNAFMQLAQGYLTNPAQPPRSTTSSPGIPLRR